MKQCLILRGVPGCGKTRYSQAQVAGAGARVLSTDLFFTEGEAYAFEAARIGEAHGWCLREFIAAATAGGNTRLIVDNTNISTAEIAPYYALAEAHGYETEIISFRVDPVVAWERNVHDVPLDVVLEMHQRLGPERLRFPPWWRHRWTLGMEG